MNFIDQRLQSLGIILPKASVPVANYVSYTRVGNLIFIAGQTSVKADGTMLTGRLGEDLNVENGQEAARRCGLRLISQMNSDLMVEIFGDAGKHARFAVGSPALPRDAAVEIDAIFEIRG